MIYFLQAGLFGPIKIGFTAEETGCKRRDELQGAHYEQLYLMRVIPGDFSKEGQLHRQFGEYLIRGEWFQPSEDLLNFIEEQPIKLKKNKDAPTSSIEAKPQPGCITQAERQAAQRVIAQHKKQQRSAASKPVARAPKEKCQPERISITSQAEYRDTQRAIAEYQSAQQAAIEYQRRIHPIIDGATDLPGNVQIAAGALPVEACADATGAINAVVPRPGDWLGFTLNTDPNKACSIFETKYGYYPREVRRAGPVMLVGPKEEVRCQDPGGQV